MAQRADRNAAPGARQCLPTAANRAAPVTAESRRLPGVLRPPTASAVRAGVEALGRTGDRSVLRRGVSSACRCCWAQLSASSRRAAANIDPVQSYHDPGSRPAARLFRLYASSARHGGCRRGHPHGQSTAILGMVAGQVPWRCRMLPSRRCWAAAAALSLHRQRSRRGARSGQAAEPGSHRRSPDAAAPTRAESWGELRDLEAAGRRILRGGPGRSRRCAVLRERIIDRAKASGLAPIAVSPRPTMSIRPWANLTIISAS